MQNTGPIKTFHIERILHAPIQTVWQVWTDPRHIAQWWGPEGFTNTIYQMDLQPGGEWRLTMHGPDGKTYPNKSQFKEIEHHKKIVFQHYNPHYLAIISFEAQHNQTLLKWTMDFETPELYQTVINVFKADEGLIQNVQKLEQYLIQQSHL